MIHKSTYKVKVISEMDHTLSARQIQTILETMTGDMIMVTKEV